MLQSLLNSEKAGVESLVGNDRSDEDIGRREDFEYELMILDKDLSQCRDKFFDSIIKETNSRDIGISRPDLASSCSLPLEGLIADREESSLLTSSFYQLSVVFQQHICQHYYKCRKSIQSGWTESCDRKKILISVNSLSKGKIYKLFQPDVTRDR